MARRRGDPQLSAWPARIQRMQLKTIALETEIVTAQFWQRLDRLADLQLQLTRATAALDRAKLSTMNGEGLLDRPGHRPGQHCALRRPGPRTSST